MRTEALVIALVLAQGVAAQPQSAPDARQLLQNARAVFQPLPPALQDNPQRVALGRRLFFETRVSADGNVGCAHCHQPELYGADGLEKSVGVFGNVAARNAPTVFNSSLNLTQHWRGDRASLSEQAEKSLLGAASYGNPDYASAMNRLKAIPGYRQDFAQAFPGAGDPINSRNWGEAIASYERALLTPGRFDAFLAGDLAALTPPEQAGLRTFMDLGCAACHAGAGVGGGSLEKFGVHGDYWKETGAAPDKGRFDVTGKAEDLYVFKVPSLRNVEKTAPYFHDGAVAELPRAVKIMGRAQLGIEIADRDAEAVVAFLRSLTGSIPQNFSAPEPYPDAP